ncbi:MAG: tail fiber domain-containing protein [bacterium]
MTRMVTLTVTLIVALLALVSLATADVPQMINYQGRLTDGGGPVAATVAMTFTIYDASSSGNSKWTELHPSVDVVDGLFNVILGDGTPAVPIEDTVFSGADRWLEIIVGGETIAPRSKLASNPYAFQSNWTLVGEVLYTSGEWGIARGGADNMLYGDFANRHINLGRACTTGTDGSHDQDVTVSGGHRNLASGGGSTVGGGSYNQATGVSSTVSGGDRNQANGEEATISGGYFNRATGDWTTISGGYDNQVTFKFCTIGGGASNIAGGSTWGRSTIAGGYSNKATKDCSTVGGGYYNWATGPYSTIPGGRNNEATGNYSFAAGHRAKAINDGAFVWADQTDADFSSTASDQFLIRASGGVGIGTNTPATELDVNGDVTATTYYGDGSYLTGIAGGGNWSVTDSVLYTDQSWGIAKGGVGNVLYGNNTFSHINLGRACTTGTDGSSKSNCAVGGGESNTASNDFSTVGGGAQNTAAGSSSTVAGGFHNTASGYKSTVGGGSDNEANGYCSVAPGGRDNVADSSYTFAAGRRAKAIHDGAFVWGGQTDSDFNSQRSEQFRVRAGGGARFDVNNGRWLQIYDDGVDVITTSMGAHLTVGGVWTNASDRNLKENFSPVDSREILEKIVQLPITQWNYRSENDNITHIGPIAQDFHELFGVGGDDKSISTIDPAGISLVAIQELAKQNQEMRQRIDQLEALVETVLAQQKDTNGGSEELANSK